LQEIVTRGTHEEKLNIVEIAYANGHELHFAKHIALQGVSKKTEQI
jgi:hypothetical protein